MVGRVLDKAERPRLSQLLDVVEENHKRKPQTEATG